MERRALAYGCPWAWFRPGAGDAGVDDDNDNGIAGDGRSLFVAAKRQRAVYGPELLR